MVISLYYCTESSKQLINEVLLFFLILWMRKLRIGEDK